MWVLRNWLRAVMFSGGLEGGYVGAPTIAFTNNQCNGYELKFHRLQFKAFTNYQCDGYAVYITQTAVDSIY